MVAFTNELYLRGLPHEIAAFSIGTDRDISLKKARSCISPQESARAARIVFEADRDRFIRSRGYIRHRLADRLGVRPSGVPLVSDPDGRPQLSGSALAFNLAQSGDRAVLVITKHGHVGVDMECLDESDLVRHDLEGLAALCMTPSEKALIGGLPKETKNRRFLEFWTAKEALMKLSGEDFKMEPSQIALALKFDRPVGFRAPFVPDVETRFLVTPWDDAVCCLVTAPALEERTRLVAG